MNSAEAVVATFVFCFVAFLFVIVGIVEESNSWQHDCDKVGKHINGETIYTCSKEVAK